MARQARYTPAAVMASQKCHGTLWRAVESTSDAVSTKVPQVGHSPISVTEEGFQNRSQGSHHGTSLACHRQRLRSLPLPSRAANSVFCGRPGVRKMMVLHRAVVAFACLAEGFGRWADSRASSLIPGKLPELRFASLTISGANDPRSARHTRARSPMSPTFALLGVPEHVCRALERGGILKPFEIQAAVIADALEGRDICGRAPTGSGKTLAFGIPLVVNVDQAKPRRPRALVLSPTRELADQIASELRSFAGQTKIGAVYGGVGYGVQQKQLQRGIDILVACPGRLEDLMAQNAVSLHEVDQVVIDEADRMADMGFLPAVRRILDQTATDRQTVMFSATLDRDAAKITRDYQHRPVTHEVGEVKPDIEAADHRFWSVDKTERIAACVDVISTTGSAIVFCRTRHGSDRLARQLVQRGINASAIHGGHAQNRRRRTLQEFIDGRVQALVATDVAARGIHVDSVASVIHFDPPEDQKAYLHRSGRTARAGQKGLVVSLVQSNQVGDTKHMQRQLGLKQPITSPDLSDDHTVPPRPRKQSDQQSKSRNGQGPKRQSQDGRNRSGPKKKNRNGQGPKRQSQGRPHRQNRNKPRSGASSR